MGNGVAKAESLISNLVHSRCNSKAQTIGIPWNVPVGHRELRIIANEVGPFCVSLQGEMFSEIGICFACSFFSFTTTDSGPREDIGTKEP